MKGEKQETFKVIDNYIISLKDILGSGAYGTVYGGTLSDKKQQIAVKQISLSILNKKNSDKILVTLKNEIANMRMLNHPNIVRLLDVKKSTNNLYLIMEYCNEGSLESHLTKNMGSLSESDGLKMIKELVAGYEALYRNNIVHRDLKPANILLHDGTAKLGDFGFSKVVEHGLEDPQLISQVGSPLYMSPQILKGESYSTKCDVWSMAMIFYQMLFGRTPWNGKTPYELLKNIYSQPLIFSKSVVLKNTLVLDLLRKMLEKKEDDRISWDDIFSHPLFKKEDLEGNLKQSVNLARKEEDNLSKSRALNEIYFEQNRVVKNPYDCVKRMSINRFVIPEEAQTPVKEVSGKEDNSTQPSMSNFTKCSEIPSGEQTDRIEKDYEALLEEQKKRREEKKIVQLISDWVLHRRNKGIFLNTLTIKLHEFVINKRFNASSDLYFRFIFLLSKYQTMILYKIYVRLKSCLCDKFKKFSEADWKFFVKTKERQDLFLFIKDDLTVVKMFFGEFMSTTKMFLNKTLAKSEKELDSRTRRKLADMGKICDNQLCEKDFFMILYMEVITDFLDQFKKQFEKVKGDRDILLFACYALDALNISNLFKWKTEDRIDFNKYYEEKDNSDLEKLIVYLKTKLDIK